jgi:hypothetical protein
MGRESLLRPSAPPPCYGAGSDPGTPWTCWPSQGRQARPWCRGGPCRKGRVLGRPCPPPPTQLMLHPHSNPTPKAAAVFRHFCVKMRAGSAEARGGGGGGARRRQRRWHAAVAVGAAVRRAWRTWASRRRAGVQRGTLWCRGGSSAEATVPSSLGGHRRPGRET